VCEYDSLDMSCKLGSWCNPSLQNGLLYLPWECYWQHARSIVALIVSVREIGVVNRAFDWLDQWVESRHCIGGCGDDVIELSECLTGQPPPPPPVPLSAATRVLDLETTGHDGDDSVDVDDNVVEAADEAVGAVAATTVEASSGLDPSGPCGNPARHKARQS
jgi:hypothetical protein